MSESVDWDSLSNSEIARSVWALATVGVEPQSMLGDSFSSRVNLNDKELSHLIWGLSKWASKNTENQHFLHFTDLIQRIDDDRALSLSNDDMIAILRACASVYNQ
jgi:hypothetical protein